MDVSCRVAAGEPCTLTASDGVHTVTVTGPVPESARSRPLTREDLITRLQKTGGTASLPPDGRGGGGRSGPFRQRRQRAAAGPPRPR